MILEKLNNNINQFSNHPAIISNDINLTYKELSEKIESFAAILSNLGIKQKDSVAILCKDNFDFVIVLLAIWELSAVAIPLNHRLTDNELEKQIIHSKAGFVLIHQTQKERLTECKVHSFIFPFPSAFHTEHHLVDRPYYSNNTSLLLYTSGSTGIPKGVMLSLNNLFSSATAADSLFHFTKDDSWLLSLPLYHIGGIQILIRAFMFGSTLVIPESLKTPDIIGALSKFKPTLLSVVSTTLARFVKNVIIPNDNLRLVFLGGGPSTNELVNNAVRNNWNIVKVYGSTETSSMVTAFIVKNNLDKIDSSGKPLGKNNIFIINENNTPLPLNITGEIVVASNSIMNGYLNNPTESNRRLLNGMYYTQDYGYLDEDGFLYVINRKDNMIISGGENINPREIEEAILRMQGIKNVCVVGLDDSEWGQVVAAAIVKDNSIDLSMEEIIENLKKELGSYKVPKRILFKDKLPTTALGKIKVNDIRKLFNE